MQHMLAQHTRHRHTGTQTHRHTDTGTQIHRHTDTQPEPQPHSHAATHPDFAVAIDCKHISFRWAAVSRSTACWRYAWVAVSPCTAAAVAAREVAGRPTITRGTITPPRRPHLCPIVGHGALDTLLVEPGGMASQARALCGARWGHARFKGAGYLSTSTQPHSSQHVRRPLAHLPLGATHFRMVSLTMESISTWEDTPQWSGGRGRQATPTNSVGVGQVLDKCC